ncbi:MAG: hypothetical protein NTU95_04790 [Methanothrix sp.]|nr:hypothetical protein [Methanothrix sp.]
MPYRFRLQSPGPRAQAHLGAPPPTCGRMRASGPVHGGRRTRMRSEPGRATLAPRPRQPRRNENAQESPIHFRPGHGKKTYI